MPNSTRPFRGSGGFPVGNGRLRPSEHELSLSEMADFALDLQPNRISDGSGDPSRRLRMNRADAPGRRWSLTVGSRIGS
jgi:hypothetical protein